MRCFDSSNYSSESNVFRIIVVNVNDRPAILSDPPKTAIAGQEYGYNVLAVDGDNDTITYALTKKPQNMTVNSSSGAISWIPNSGGVCEVMVEASDGSLAAAQNYYISVPYRPPRITNSTVPEAQTGALYTYDIPAVSDDGRELAFKLLSSIEGMTIHSSSGRLSWTPNYPGDYPVSVNISDSKTSLLYNFTIHVIKGNNPPTFSSEPVKNATVGFEYIYQVVVGDADGDTPAFSLASAPAGMTIGPSTGKISWLPDVPGKYTVKVRVSDGKGAETVQEFTITVAEAGRQVITFIKPLAGQKVRGTLAVSVTAVKWASEIVKVQIRVDSGEWMDAKGNFTWQRNIDTTKLSNGKHVLYARAYDGTSYSETINRTVIVDNKAGGGTFIPGLEAALVVPAFLAALFFFVRRRERHHC